MEIIHPVLPEPSRLPRSEAQKIKNLTAFVILLGGLLAGSLAVDVAQLSVGRGFSSRAVASHTVLPAGDRTWVAYADPKIAVQVITDQACVTCDMGEALVWLRRALPTIEVTETDRATELGRVLIDRFQIGTLPAFVFSKSIEQTDFYTQAKTLFQGQSDRYFFDMTRIGLPAGEYLKAPPVADGDIVLGRAGATLSVIAYTDYQCAFCKGYQTTLLRALKEYGERVRFVIKSLPLPSHPQAEPAAEAVRCAFEQGKYETYSAYLFGKQAEWGNAAGTQRFKDYAWYLGLDGRAFGRCLETGRYRDQVAADLDEAGRFALVGAPETFVGTTLLKGAVPYEVLQQTLDQALAQ